MPPGKRIILERANRLYQMPPVLDEYLREPRSLLPRQVPTIDLARFRWSSVVSDAKVSSPGSPADDKLLRQVTDRFGEWLESRNGTRLSPSTEILITGGITSSLTATCLGLLDRTEVALIPSVGLPSYRRAIVAAGGEPVTYPIDHKQHWRADFECLDGALGRSARLLILNQPHNPTGHAMTRAELAFLVEQAARSNTLVISDAAFCQIADDDTATLSQIDSFERVGIELYNAAYLFGTPQNGIGFAVGNRDALAALRDVQRLVPPYWSAGAVADVMAAMDNSSIDTVRQTLATRRERLSRLAESQRLSVDDQPALPFLWTRLNRRVTSMRAARWLSRRYATLVMPGLAFGEAANNYLRLSLAADPSAVEAATERLRSPLLFGRSA